MTFKQNPFKYDKAYLKEQTDLDFFLDCLAGAYRSVY